MRPEEVTRTPNNKRNRMIGVGFVGFFIVAGVFLAGVILGQEDVLSFNFGRDLNDDSSSVISIGSDNTGDDLPANLNYDSVEEVYDLLRRRYDGDLDAATLLEGIKQGLANATGDPYTEFFTVEGAEAFNNELDGTFTGIGAELGKQDGALIVVSPLEGFPAEAAGLRPQDVIARIDDTDTLNMTISEAVSLIRGPEGEDVTLTIVRNQAEVLEITITRAVIDAPSVTYEIDNGIGILRVSRFSDDTTEIANQAANEFRDNGVSGVILDMRGNPGGFLEEAVTLSGLWLDSSRVVVDVRRDGVSEQTLRARGTRLLEGIPTVVLINEGSASASEIVAGALQDYDVATVVGLTSFGKGSVQNLEDLGGGELLKVTTARWFTPNGNNIDQEGITPDEQIEISEEQFNNGDDPQLDRAKQILSN